jgi:hypothetical protein
VLATLEDAFQLQKRGLKMRLMTWRALCISPYAAPPPPAPGPAPPAPLPPPAPPPQPLRKPQSPGTAAGEQSSSGCNRTNKSCAAPSPVLQRRKWKLKAKFESRSAKFTSFKRRIGSQARSTRDPAGVNPGSTRGQPGSTRGQPGVNLRRPCRGSEEVRRLVVQHHRAGYVPFLGVVAQMES